MTKVFISYSRKDKIFAGRFTEALQKSELETWIDWEDIPPTADWMDQIHKGIEQADAFLFLLSPDSVASKVCGQEVDYAVHNGKRLIPIVARDVNPNDVHPAMAKVNWVYCREGDDFDSAINKTLSAIRTDLVWVESHRRLQVRAIEWERKNKENSFLLRGKDLQDAEQQLSIHATADPQPTDLQREYALRSRQVADRQRRLITTLSIVAAVIMLGLAIFGFNQSVEATSQRNTAVANEHTAQTAQADAEKQARIALSRQLAAQANNVLSEQPDLALLLSVASYRNADTTETRDVLLKSLLHEPRLIGVVRTQAAVTSVSFSEGAEYFAAGLENGSVYVWKNIYKRENVATFTSDEGAVRGLFFDPDNPNLTTIRCKDDEGFIEPHYTIDCRFVTTNLQSQVSKTFSILDARWPITISADGHLLAFNTTTGIQLWDAKNDRALGEPLSLREGVDIESLAFSPDNHWLIAGECINGIDLYFCPDGIIEGWNIGAPEQEIPPPSGILGHQGNRVGSLAFDLSGTILASGSCIHLETDLGNCPGGEVNIWNVQVLADDKISLQKVGSSEFTQSGPITNLSVNRANQGISGENIGIVVAGGGDDRVYLYREPYFSVGTWEGTSFVGSNSPINGLAISPGGRWLIVASSMDIRFWEINPDPLIKHTFNARITTIRTIAFTAPGSFTGADYHGYFLDVDLSTGIMTPTDYPSPGISIVAPGGEPVALVTFEDGKTSQLVNLKTNKPLSPPLEGISGYFDQGGMTGLASGLTLSPDGDILAATDYEKTVFWDMASSSYVSSLSATILEGGADGTSIAFNPSGKYLAIGTMTNGIKVWDVKKRSLLFRIFPGANTPYTALTFTPDDRMIVAGVCRTYLATELGEQCQESEIVIWDLVTNQSFGASIPVGEGLITGLAFDQSGNQLVAIVMHYTEESDVTGWDFNVVNWAQFACDSAGRNFTHDEWAKYFPGKPYPIERKDATCPQWPLEPEVTMTPAP